MTDRRSYLEALTPKMGLALLLAVLFFVVVLNGHAYSATEPNSSPQDSADILKNPEIDRIIPSKPDDLFVVLKNGLTVLIRESHGSTVVSSHILVRTGSIYEGERIQGGLSHYLEHVVSGGTTSKLSETQIKERLQAIGGATNAYTGYENTVYYIKTTRAHYEEALHLLLGYVTDCQFDETEYQREKGVILQEFQMGENDPSWQLWYTFMKTAYRYHPVRYPVIGEKEIFLNMGKEDLIAHYRRWYTPENMVVSVAGDVEKEEVLRTIIDFAGSVKRATNPPYVLPIEPAQFAPRTVEKSLAMARIAQAQLGFRTVGLTDPDLYPVDVLAVIMGDGRTSKLYQTVRDEKGLVLSISAASWTPTFAKGQFLISMDLAYKDLSEAIDAVWEEISAVQKDSISKEALRRAKNKVVADHVYGQESAQSQARQLAVDWVTTGDPYFSENYVARIQEVTGEDVMRVAKKYFRRDRMTLAVIKPSEAASKTGESHTPPSGLKEKVERVILPNQMTLLLKRNTAAPIVVLKLIIRGGLRFEPVDKPGLSHFMASLLTKGTKNRSKAEIARAIEDVGGSIESSSGYNSVSVSVTVLREHFDIALDLLSDVALHPTFPKEEITKQRRETLMAIQRLDENWTTEIARMMKRHYYHKHPYRNDVIGSAKAVERFSGKQIRDFYESVMMPNNAVLSIFGDIDSEMVTSMVEEAFGDFQPGILEQPIIEIETQNIIQDESFEVFNEKTAAAIVVGYNGLTLTDIDGPVVDVLDAVISGIRYPSGWLHEALRGGDRSLVYVVHAYPSFGIDGGYFGIMAQTAPDNYESVLRIVLDKMDLIQKGTVDPTTLDQAKNMCIAAHEMGLETIASQTSSAALNEILGLGYDYDVKYPDLIESVSAEDVLRVAKKLFAHHLIVATKPNSMTVDD
jgi:zinc protease